MLLTVGELCRPKGACIKNNGVFVMALGTHRSQDDSFHEGNKTDRYLALKQVQGIISSHNQDRARG